MLTIKRTAPAAVLEVMLWKPSRPVKVTRNGALCDGIGYGNRELALIAWTGKQVIVRVDPNDVGKAAICEPNGRLICMAESNEKLPHNTPKAQLKEATAKLNRSKKQVKDFYTQRPRVDHDVAGQLYLDRAEEIRKQQEKAQTPAATMKMLQTPLDGSQPVIEQALDRNPLPSAGASDDQRLPNRFIYDAEFAPEPEERPVSFRDLYTAFEQKRQGEELAAELESQSDPFEPMMEVFADNRESEAG